MKPPTDQWLKESIQEGKRGDPEGEERRRAVAAGCSSSWLPAVVGGVGRMVDLSNERGVRTWILNLIFPYIYT